ncbi:MAG: ParB/RepB/Spo0J family partition protein [Nitrospirae bacterium]|nr:MAG: ParB/RepB/Spo0J family partition protein [Nitrospirota bacterium]
MKTALGKGLKALIPETEEQKVQELPVESIMPNPEQPRKDFDEEGLRELAESIKQKGVLQPIIVRKDPSGGYIIVAGERRWRASKMAGLKKIPAMVMDVGREESLEVALIENIQRDDLGPLEMAEAFKKLIEEFRYTQETLASKIGKDRATVANYLRLLNLPPDVKDALKKGLITMGHAKAILSLPTKALQVEVTRQVLSKGLSVRQTEALCRDLQSKDKKAKKTRQKKKDPNIQALEDKLRQSLGTKVTLKHRGQRGKIEIEYYSLDELDRLIEVLAG